MASVLVESRQRGDGDPRPINPTAGDSGPGDPGPGVRSGDVRIPTGCQSETLWFVVIGAICIIAGGLVAAVTAPRPTEHATWTAAYLVLVCGVSQIGLGLGQTLSTRRTPGPLIALRLICLNLGNLGVVAGTLTGRPALVDVGGTLLVVALVLLARNLFPVRARFTGALRWLRYGYALLLLTLLLSIPVGLVVARLHS